MKASNPRYWRIGERVFFYGSSKDAKVLERKLYPDALYTDHTVISTAEIKDIIENAYIKRGIELHIDKYAKTTPAKVITDLFIKYGIIYYQ